MLTVHIGARIGSYLAAREGFKEQTNKQTKNSTIIISVLTEDLTGKLHDHFYRMRKLLAHNLYKHWIQLYVIDCLDLFQGWGLNITTAQYWLNHRQTHINTQSCLLSLVLVFSVSFFFTAMAALKCYQLKDCNTAVFHQLWDPKHWYSTSLKWE